MLSTPGTVLVYGHRGAPRQRPENTLASFRRARALGADGVEFDVRLTLDGHPVVLHDDTLDRTTTGSGAVSQALLSEIRSLGVRGAADGPDGEQARVPTLAETCHVCAQEGLAMDVEIKAGADPERVAAAVASVLDATGWLDGATADPRSLLVTSFEAAALRAMHAVRPAVRLGLLLGAPPEGAAVAGWAKDNWALAQEAGARILLPRLDVLSEWAEQWDSALPTIAWCGSLPPGLPRHLWHRPGMLGLIGDDPAQIRSCLAPDAPAGC